MLTNEILIKLINAYTHCIPVMKNIKEERFVNVVLSFHYQQQLSWGYHACNTKLLLVSHSLIP